MNNWLVTSFQGVLSTIHRCLFNFKWNKIIHDSNNNCKNYRNAQHALLSLIKGCPKKTFTNVNTAFNVLFRGQDGIFFFKIFVYYIYVWFIINFAYICLDFMENWRFYKDSSKIQPASSALAWFSEYFLLLFVKFKSIFLEDIFCNFCYC